VPTNAYGFYYADANSAYSPSTDQKAIVDSVGPYSNMRFASTAARDAVLTSPLEGMEAWTQDTNTKWYYDGTTWKIFGQDRVRVGTTKRTANSGAVTAETVIDSVSFPQISGRTYAILYATRGNSTVSGDTFSLAIREDNISGNTLASENYYNFQTTGGYGATLYTEYVAGATGTKTIVGTLARFAGTGNMSSGAAAGIPTFLVVDQIG
jgi:hypothetical protein